MEIINHPVHIVTKNNRISPSAFIPFCDFGGNMSAMGIMIENFSYPVCNSFQKTILNDQLCYEVDLDRFVDKNKFEKYLKFGFNFLMDYNEDRQVTFDKIINKAKGDSLAENMVESDDDKHAHIYMDTIGKINYISSINAIRFFVYQSQSYYLERENITWMILKLSQQLIHIMNWTRKEWERHRNESK